MTTISIAMILIFLLMICLTCSNAFLSSAIGYRGKMIRRCSSRGSGSGGSGSGSGKGGVEWSDLQLGNVLPISDFLSSFTYPFDSTTTTSSTTTTTSTTTEEEKAIPLRGRRGVFVLEDINQQVIVVDYHDSNEQDRKDDLFAHIQASIDHFSQYQPVAIRVQTFPSTAPPGLPKAYAEELRRHVNPMNPPMPTTTTTTSTSTTTTTTTSPNAVITVELADSSSSSTSSSGGDDDDGGDGEQIISPFANTNNQVKEAVVASTVSEDAEEEELPLTVSNVEKTLDKIRPYLIVDGGNVAVVAIDENTRSIQLILEGACGSCPSSTTTMKMGIERILREKFSHLGEIIAVKEEESVLTLASIKKALVNLLPAIESLGGQVTFHHVDAVNGIVTVSFQGPEKLKKGVDLVIRDVSGVKDVVFLDDTSSP